MHGLYDTGRFADVTADHVQSRAGFREVVAALVADYRSQGHQWENGNLERFLEALEASVTDVRDEDPSWRLMAEHLIRATGYE